MLLILALFFGCVFVACLACLPAQKKLLGFFWSSYESYPLESKISELQTGDLLYFCCYNSITDYLIMLFNSHRLITHVGMAVVRKGEVMVLEAVRKADVRTDCRLDHHQHEGVRLVPLRKKMSAKSPLVSNWVIVQPLAAPDRMRPAMNSALDVFLRSVDASEYTHHPICMCLEPLTGPVGSGWSDSSDVAENGRKRYFCSSLVADAYRAMGLLPRDWNIYNTMPRDFIEGYVQLPLMCRLSSYPYYIFPDVRNATQKRIISPPESSDAAGPVQPSASLMRSGAPRPAQLKLPRLPKKR